MSLVLYNTLKRAKEPFTPLRPDHVGMYVCGPTVYDLAHIGNARPVIVFDVLYRLLKRRYPRVTYVRNITDVDDKINAAAKANSEPIAALTQRTTAQFHADIAALNALPPDVEPRATEHIGEMIALIQILIARDHAYAAEGHVLFSVSSDAAYGKLSNRSRDEMIAGARVDVAPYKKDPADFVLWKPSSPDLPGWDSPWGRGRPGWHIECSAMSKKHLGETIDIHGGGVDLVFPHHENEVAQSECAHGTTFARYWVHNGFLTVNGEKMSKSLGNFITIREALNRMRGEAIRYNMLGTHYRQPADWTTGERGGEGGAEKAMDGFYRLLAEFDPSIQPSETVPDAVAAALDDDLNTPLALHHLRELQKSVRAESDASIRRSLAEDFLAGGRALGLFQWDPKDWFQSASPQLTDPAILSSTTSGSVPQRKKPMAHKEEHLFETPFVLREQARLDAERAELEREIERQIDLRLEARARKDFAEADRIRNELAKQGIVLEDVPTGRTRWRRAR